MLVEYIDGMGKVLFGSHQWLAFDEPDPHFQQFQVLQQALENIINGTTKVQNSVGDQLMNGVKGEMSAEVASSMMHAFLWYDYFGVPQVCDAEIE